MTTTRKFVYAQSLRWWLADRIMAIASWVAGDTEENENQWFRNNVM